MGTVTLTGYPSHLGSEVSAGTVAERLGAPKFAVLSPWFLRSFLLSGCLARDDALVPMLVDGARIAY